ncbi:MAG: hypothetical protein II057_06970, partial [Clostridia bacterium]|nr:hypothetical protein [Clostridia bacterium]
IFQKGKIEEKTVKRKQKALHFAESYFPNPKNGALFHIFDRVLDRGKVLAFTGWNCGNFPSRSP